MANLKKKIVNRTREQIISEMLQNKDFKERLAFLKDKFYPAVINASKNIEDSKIFLDSIVTVIMEKFLGLMKEKKFEELGLIDALEPSDPMYDQYCDLLNLFNGMSVFEARGHFERMKTEIDRFIQDEMISRSLSTLSPHWVDEVIIKKPGDGKL